MPTTRAEPVVGPTGDVAHPLLIARSPQYEPRVHEVTPEVFCAVGFGISNTTLVLGPTGAVIIDSGECREELAEVLDAFGDRLDRPVVGVIFTHSHYLWGTAALHDRGFTDLEIWGHEDIEEVIADVGAEIGPAYARRARLQFGFHLPATGPDSMSNVGLGRFFYRPGTKTGGFVPANRRVPRHGTASAEMAGLRFDMAAFDSDSEDTIVIHIPELGVCVNNHIWPVLFNIYPLRGERYRDPLVLLDGYHHIASLDPEHLVATHGVPINGRAPCRQAVADHADAVQFLWDKTVRGINAGLEPDELAASVELPARLAESPWIQPLYGEVPFHVKQIHNGLFGWFGTDTATLRPVAPRRRAELTVSAMGGRDAVLRDAQAAVDRGEHEWAAELMSHLLRLDPADADARALKAACLRWLSQHTTAANTRAHYLAEALTLDGVIDPLGDTPFVPAIGAVLRMGPVRALHSLRVQLDPVASAATDVTLAVRFSDRAGSPDEHAWMHVHRGVARTGPGHPPRTDMEISLTTQEWARLRSRRVTVADAELAQSTGTRADLSAFFALFDHGPR